ncbi:MAG: signal peptidase I [Lachnospiraceae bacterium]|nr:signal peptidase I [Lachnospiraceae bacterium]
MEVGEKEKNIQNKKARMRGVLFYIFLVVILVAVFFLTREEAAGVPRHIAGLSAMRVLTGSMQSEIPRDALIVTRQVDPQEIRVGDDITFMVSETTTMTHRVVLIYEDYRDTGQRGFQTQGVENPSPDREIVRPENIVGRVVWHNLLLGRAMFFIRENVIAIGIFVALLIAFVAMMRIVLKRKDAPGEVEQEDDMEVDRIKEEILDLLGIN